MLRILSSILILIAGGVLFWQWPGSTATKADAGAVPAEQSQAPAKPQQSKIWLMTSLPIVWGENGSMDNILSGQAQPAAIYRYWKSRYDIDAVDSFEALETSDVDTVILAQPKAMDPADIAALDKWIRAGGRALIMTDPLLVWPSDLPLGDNRRPLASGLLSPLLTHWGLQLQMPEGDAAGGVEMGFDGYSVSTAGIGTLVLTTKKALPGADCKILNRNLVAECDVGDGRAVIIADADFLHEDLWEKDAGQAGAVKWVDSFLAGLQKI